MFEDTNIIAIKVKSNKYISLILRIKEKEIFLGKKIETSRT